MIYTRRMKPHTIAPLTLALTFLAACGDDTGSGDDPATTSTSTTGSETTADTCKPGLEGCPCRDGLCAVGLLCLSDLCVEPPPPASTGEAVTDGGEATGDPTSDPTTDSGIPASCFSNDECADDEVCFETSCTWFGNLDYDVTITKFVPPSCRDGFGSAEVVYRANVNDALEHASAEASCPSAWPDETFRVGGLETFSLEFWEVDGFTDDYFANICWQQYVEGECSEMAAYVFHDGGFAGYTGDGVYEFSLTAYPAAWCNAFPC